MMQMEVVYLFTAFMATIISIVGVIEKGKWWYMISLVSVLALLTSFRAIALTEMIPMPLGLLHLNI